MECCVLRIAWGHYSIEEADGKVGGVNRAQVWWGGRGPPPNKPE
jgi:hypothetical protein